LQEGFRRAPSLESTEHRRRAATEPDEPVFHLGSSLVAQARERRVVLITSTADLTTPVLLSHAPGNTAADAQLIFGQGDVASRCTDLLARGVDVLVVPRGTEPPGCNDAARPRLELKAALAALRQCCGVRSVMIEGGAGVISSVLSEGIVDDVVVTLAPVFVGGLSVVGPRALTAPSRLRQTTVSVLGDDVVIHGTLH